MARFSSLSLRWRKRPKGFTVIELLAASIILSMLGIYTWMTIRASFQTQRTVSDFADLYDQASAVTSKVSTDLQQMFLVPSHQNLTYMIGKPEEISFTSLAHTALMPETRESEQTEIVYKTENNPNRNSLKVLLRSETGFIDGPKEDKEKVQFETLSGHLESIAFEYSKDGVAYVKQWDTTQTEHKNKLPKIIKLTLVFKEDAQDKDTQEPKEVMLETTIDIPMAAFAPSEKSKPENKQEDKDKKTSASPTATNPGGPGFIK